MFLPVETVLWEAEFADRDAQLDFGVFFARDFTLILKLKNPFDQEEVPEDGVLGNAQKLSGQTGLLCGTASHIIFAGGVFNIYCKTPTLVTPSKRRRPGIVIKDRL